MNIPQLVMWKIINDQNQRLLRGRIPRQNEDDEDENDNTSQSCFWEVLSLIGIIVFVVYMMFFRQIPSPAVVPKASSFSSGLHAKNPNPLARPDAPKAR